jgi:hypothetical protein
MFSICIYFDFEVNEKKKFRKKVLKEKFIITMYENTHISHRDQQKLDLTEKAQLFDDEGIKYHIFGDGGYFSGGAPTNIYVVDPTGDSIQMDGRWSQVRHIQYAYISIHI